MESLGIGPREADSILRLVRTRLDLSLDRMLALRVSDPPGPPGPRR